MPSFNRASLLAIAIAFSASAFWSTRAHAQQAAQGFSVERFSPSAPGAGWFVMDSLDMHAGLGAAAGLTIGYAHDPLRIRSADGSQRLAVVADQAFADLGFAASYERWRFHIGFGVPLALGGQSGVVGAYTYAAPSVDPGSHPDSLYDARVGLDARIVGDAGSPFRMGVGAVLYVPSGNRGDYDTDDTFRAAGRVLVAGDFHDFAYAAQLGVHVRPLDDSSTPGSPRGTELTFGAAGGATVARVGEDASFIVGPELFGASAFASLFDSNATALEALLTGRFEGMRRGRSMLRARLGAGAGLNPHFGAPEWRFVLGVELFTLPEAR